MNQTTKPELPVAKKRFAGLISKLSRRSWYFVAVAISVLVLVGGVLALQTNRTGISDAERSADLHAIQEALIDHLEANGDLPADLDVLEIELFGSTSDYEYNFEGSVPGSPSDVYQLCAVFNEPGLSIDHDVLAPGADTFDLPLDNAFSYHRSGRQCYNDGYYKGSSHVNYVLIDKEIVPLPVYDTDFVAFVDAVWQLYSAHAPILGITPSQNDLSKTCIQRAQKSEAPSGLAYSCTIEVREENTEVTDRAQGMDLVDQLAALTTVDNGFSSPIIRESGPLQSEFIDEDIYSQTLSTRKDRCNIDVRFSSPVAGISYTLSCNAQDSAEVPAGFRLETR